MRKLDRDTETKNAPPDFIDILVGVCRYGALAFAALAVYFIYFKQQSVVWPALVSIVLLIAGLVLAYIPKKVKTSEGEKDKKIW